MGRRSGFGGFMAAVARDAARAQRQAATNQRRLIRDHQRAMRQAERNRILAAKEARQRYLEERLQEVEDKNEALNDYIHELQGILDFTLSIDDTISFDSLRSAEGFRQFVVPKVISEPHSEPLRDHFLLQ
jgi:restriction system protein